MKSYYYCNIFYRLKELIGNLTDVIEKSKPEEISNIQQGKLQSDGNDVEQSLLQFQQLPRICTSDSRRRGYKSLKRKCHICGSKVEKGNKKNPQMKDSGYFAKGQKLKKYKSEMKVCEPVLANPNSYISIKKVLEELKVNHSIGD